MRWDGGPTGEELKDEEAPADLIEDVVPDEAAALEAALAHVQHVVAPEDPAARLPISAAFFTSCVHDESSGRFGLPAWRLWADCQFQAQNAVLCQPQTACCSHAL